MPEISSESVNSTVLSSGTQCKECEECEECKECEDFTAILYYDIKANGGNIQLSNKKQYLTTVGMVVSSINNDAKVTLTNDVTLDRVIIYSSGVTTDTTNQSFNLNLDLIINSSNTTTLSNVNIPLNTNINNTNYGSALVEQDLSSPIPLKSGDTISVSVTGQPNNSTNILQIIVILIGHTT